MTGIDFFADYEAELQKTYGEPGSTLVTVSGLAGVGTSTIAKMLSKHLELTRVNAGDFFRNLADEFDMSIQEFDERTQELEQRERRDFDLEWDKSVLKRAYTEDNILFEGRLAGALLSDIAPVRVYVACDTDTVAQRIAGRENLSTTEAKEHIEVRNQKVRERYQKKYGVDPHDSAYYNVHIDNSAPLEQVQETLFSKVNALLQ